MLIQDYELEVFTPPCEPGAARFAARAHLQGDIRAVLPYLNAVLEGAEYNSAAPAVVWRKARRTIVFHPREIAASNMTDRDEAEREIGALVELVNRTWDRRAEVEPSEAGRRRPSHLALFKLLPGTNCGDCGQPTCYNFALKLVAGQAALADCAPLMKPEHQAAHRQLVTLLASP